MACPICDKRKQKRSCPAKGVSICSLCCGRGREVSINCPLDCSYLLESREREYVGHLSPQDFPFKEIEVSREFIEEKRDLVNGLAQGILESSLTVAGTSDVDTQQALEALIEGYKALQSGIHYEPRPNSACARAVAEQMRERIQNLLSKEKEQTGFKHTRDGDVMTLLIFLYRMALDRDNRKPRGRAFVHFLQRHFQVVGHTHSNLIVPGRSKF